MKKLYAHTQKGRTSTVYLKCSSVNRKSKIYYHFLIIFFALFGPKIGGYIDLSVLVPVVSLFVLMALRRNLRISTNGLILLSIMLLIFLYTFAGCLFHNVPDTYVLFRSIRAFVSSVFLGVIFYSLAATGEMRVECLVRAVVFSLFILSFVMLLQVGVPSVQPVFATVYEFDKPLREYRAFGLTAGYDTAGYLAAFSSIFALALYASTKSYNYLFVSVVSCCAVMFSSRSSMVLLVGLFGMFVLFFAMKKVRWLLRVIPIFVVLLMAAISYIAPLFLSTFGFLDGYISVIADIGYEPTTQFAKTDLVEDYASMWFFPKTIQAIIFGTAVNINSDVGYVKVIFMGGVSLLSLVGVFYISSLLFSIKVLRKPSNFWDVFEKFNFEVLRFGIVMLFVIIFVGNLKNLYFLTRGYHELFVILCFSRLGFLRRYKKGSRAFVNQGNEAVKEGGYVRSR